jgi:hypothetical protein
MNQTSPAESPTMLSTLSLPRTIVVLLLAPSGDDFITGI